MRAPCLPLSSRLLAASLILGLAGCAADGPPVAAIRVAPGPHAVGLSLSLDGSASADPEGAPLRYAWALTRRPPGSAAALERPESPTPSFTPDVLGTYGLRLVVHDKTQPSAPAELLVEVGCDHAPALSVAPPGPAWVGRALRLVATASAPARAEGCPEGPPPRLHWRFTARPPGSVATLDDPMAEAPQIVPDVAGTYRLELSATDRRGQRATAAVEWIARDCAAEVGALRLRADPPQAAVGAPVRVVAEGDAPAAGCPDGVARVGWSFLTFPAGFDPPPLTPGRSVHFTPSAPGEYTLAAQPAEATRPGAQITLTVGPCGAHPPRIEALELPALAVGRPGLLRARILDLDGAPPCTGDTHRYAWRIVARPGGSRAALVGADRPAPSFTPDRPGTYTVELEGTDASGRSDRAEAPLEVGVCGDQAPRVSARAEPAAPAVGARVRLAAAVEDADLDCGHPEHFAIRWEVVDLPPGIALDEARLDLAGAWFQPPAPGPYTFRVTVTDAAGHTGQAEVTVPVADCGGAAPTVDAPQIEPAVVRLGSAARLSATAADADAACGADGPLEWRWRLTARPPGSVAALSDPRAVSPRFTPDLPGDYRIAVQVTDATGRSSALAETAFSVGPCGSQPPAIAPLSATPQAPTVGQRVDLRGEAAHPDLGCGPETALRWAWRFEALPRGSAAALAQPDGPAPHFHADQAGRYSLRATVRTADGREASARLSLDVAPCAAEAPRILRISAPQGPVDLARPVALEVELAPPDPACPGAQPVALHWRLVERPAGSQAALDDPGLARPGLTPDLPGEYALEVTASDPAGRRSPPERARFSAGVCNAQRPQARIRQTAPEAPGLPVDTLSLEAYACAGADFLQLDGAGSFDPDNGPGCDAAQALSYAWRLLEGPAGGRLRVRTADRQNPSLAVDAGGRYVVGLTVSDDTGRESETARAILDVTALPPPRVDRVAPDFTCAQALAVTVSGADFLEYAGARPEVILGGVRLPADSLADCVAVVAEPAIRSCTTLRFTLPAGLAPDLYRVRVQNPFPVGCESAGGASLVIAGRPAIEAIVPDPICRGQFEGDLTLRGSGFFQAPGGRVPQIQVNGIAATVRSLEGCEPLGAGVEICRSLRFSVPASQRAAPVLAVTLTNPPPADCEEARFELIQSEPPRIDEVQPRKICDLGGNLDLTGAHFEPGMRVQLGLDFADAVALNPQGTFARATWLRDGEPRLSVGLQVLRATNPTGCGTDFEHPIRVTEGPFVFYVDPPVTYNGITLQGTVYLGNLYGGRVTRAEIRGPDGQVHPLSFTFDPQRPNRIQVILPAGLSPGRYAVTLYDDVDCPGTAEGLLTVTDRLDIALGAVTPRFGWTAQPTAITLGADPVRGFQPTPRAYLNPSRAEECAEAADCPAGGCARGRCLPACAGPADCAAGAACLDGLCQPQATELRAVVTPDPATLQAIVDAGRRPGDFDLIVVNPDGSVGLAEAAFRVTAAPPPAVDAVRPGAWPTNPGALPVVVEGQSFAGSTVEITCFDRNLNPVLAPNSVQAVTPTRIDLTVNTNPLSELSRCILRVENGDESFVDFAPISVTNPAGNFVDFTAAGPLPAPRRSPAVAPGEPSRSQRFLYVLGGDGGDPTAGRADGLRAPVDLLGDLGPWTPLEAPLPTGLSDARAVRVDDFLYLLGGVDAATGRATDAIHRALVLDPLDVPRIDNLDFEFDPDRQRLPSGTYVYRVSALLAADHPANPGGETLASDPQPVFVPAIAQGITVLIEWTAHPDAVGYRIYRSRQPDLPLGEEALLAEVPAQIRSLRDGGEGSADGARPLPPGALGTWHVGGRLSVPRAEHAVIAAPIPGAEDQTGLYAIGGIDAEGAALDTADQIRIHRAGPREQILTPLGLAAGTLRAARSRLDAVSATAATASLLPVERSVIYVLGGASGPRLDRSSERADVGPDGRLGPFSRVTDMLRARAGYAAAIANNNLVVIGGQNGEPSVTAEKGPLCAACPDPAELGNWSALGNTGANQAAVDQGRVAYRGLLYLIGGRGNAGPTARVEQSVLGGNP